MSTHEAARRAGIIGISMALLVPPALPTSASPQAAAGGAPKGGSRVGVSKRVIKIGMHAPLTGAAPLPSQAAERAKDIFFRWLHAKGRKINGRNVRVVLKNDNHNPSEAVNACKRLVTEDRVFALVGFIGVDQIQACARYAASVDVPYIAPGSTELGMDLPQTFVTSMTWPAQGPLLTDFLVAKLKARKRVNAIVWVNTANHRGARGRFVRSMRKRDAEVYSRSVPIQPTAAEAAAVISDLDTRNVKNVYVHVTPGFFLQLLQAAAQRGYSPRWTGIDVNFQYGEIARRACDDRIAHGAQFFSPYPALPDRDDFDKAFDRAVQRFHPGDGDELMWGNWAQQKVIARLLRLPGRNLTRKRFVYFAERARKIVTGVGPRLRFRPKDHFGAKQVHLNRLDCDDPAWHTKKAFVGDF